MPSIYMNRKDRHQNNSYKKKEDSNLNIKEHEKVDIENEYHIQNCLDYVYNVTYKLFLLYVNA